MDTLNTEEKQEVENMMRYLDDKIQNGSNLEPEEDDEHGRPAQNYDESPLLHMKHEESLYKEGAGDD